MYKVIVYYTDGRKREYTCADYEHGHDCMVDEYFNTSALATELVDPQGVIIEACNISHKKDD